MIMFLEIGSTASIAAVITLLVFLAVGFIAFKLLKKTVKMAFRMAIVAFIVAIGLAGTIFFYTIGTAKPATTSRPAQTR